VNTMHKKVAFQGQTNYYGCACNGLMTRIFFTELKGHNKKWGDSYLQVIAIRSLRKLVQYSSTNYYFRFLWAGFTRLPVACTYFCTAYECVICLSRSRL